MAKDKNIYEYALINSIMISSIADLVSFDAACVRARLCVCVRLWGSGVVLPPSSPQTACRDSRLSTEALDDRMILYYEPRWARGILDKENVLKLLNGGIHMQ